MIDITKLKRILLYLLFLIFGVGIIIVSSVVFSFELQDILYLAIFISCIEVCMLNLIIIGIEDTIINKIDGIYQTAYIRKSVWLKSNIIWTVVDYWILASSFLATLIVIYIAGNDTNKNKIIFYSVMSLFTSIMSYVLNPMAMAKGYRAAYQEIDKAIFKYQHSKKKNEKILLRALIKGEEYINKYSYEMKN